MDSRAQLSIDYIGGVLIFLGVVYIVFYLSMNIVAPLSKERLDVQYLAESISEYLILNFTEESAVKAFGAVNLTKLVQYLSYADLSELTGGRYKVNVTLKDMSGNTIISFGEKIPENVDVGFTRRVISTYQTSERYFLEVAVW
ncbi:hypothetical protein Ferp_0926 [Ferroglobus placidus DSM 10642]|uniref:Uncharacterized protein n=1 Tax=Ferroglobus placidus (strain DSM 10642 / AEDII12DO) TaxID=589924 RepID=D3RX79_FERPA|nr:hypothetical protein [Ferroglobus placidus]ADC65092.1 hypothetical protein Ferp_0926 [Ferroglobus placidus DSM 10642]